MPHTLDMKINDYNTQGRSNSINAVQNTICLGKLKVENIVENTKMRKSISVTLRNEIQRQ